MSTTNQSRQPEADLSRAIKEVFVSPNESDSNLEAANVVDGLFAIARAIESLATQVKYLGNGNASTEVGAIEGLSMQVKEGLEGVASSLDGIQSEMFQARTDRD